MVTVAVIAALGLSNCIITEGPASVGTGATDNPSNAVAVANGGTATGGSCLVTYGYTCIPSGAAVSTTGNAYQADRGLSWLSLTAGPGASGIVAVAGGWGGQAGASGLVAATGWGPASGVVALATLGTANGFVAGSGVGGSTGYGAVSGAGPATGGLLGLTGVGSASGSVAGTGLGNASGGLLAASGIFGSATAGTAALAGTGDSSGQYAVSGTGHATGSTAAVSGTGDSSGGTAAVSGTGDAVAPTSLDVWDDPPVGEMILLLEDDPTGGGISAQGVTAAAGSRYPVTCDPAFRNVGSGSYSNRDIELRDTISCKDNKNNPFNMQMYCHVSLYTGGNAIIAQGNAPSSTDTDQCTSILFTYGNYIPQGTHLINHFYYELTAPPGKHWEGNTAHCDGQGGRLTRCTYKQKFTA